jgi:hypothetical protein
VHELTEVLFRNSLLQKNVETVVKLAEAADEEAVSEKLTGTERFPGPVKVHLTVSSLHPGRDT